MFEILEKSSGNTIGIKLNGKLLKEDYKEFVPKLEALIEEYGAIHCYMEMTDFGGMELGAIWEELKFDCKHGSKVEKCAVVGDKTWEKWATQLSRPFFYNAKLKYFDVSEKDAAWEWLVAEGQPEVKSTGSSCGCGCNKS